MDLYNSSVTFAAVSFHLNVPSLPITLRCYNSEHSLMEARDLLADLWHINADVMDASAACLVQLMVITH